MKKFYLLPVRVVLLLCMIFSSGFLLAQEKTAAAPLHATSKKIDLNHSKAPALQNGQSVGLATAPSAISLRDHVANRVTASADIVSAQNLKKNPESGRAGDQASRIIDSSNKGQLSDPIDASQKGNSNVGSSNGANQRSPLEMMSGKTEDLSKRDAYSKQFKNVDGSYTAIIGSSPIHYQKDGKFLDINPTIVGNGDKDYPFANKTNLFESYFGANATQGIKTKTSKGEITEFLNTKMYWEVDGMEVGTLKSTNSEITVKGDKAYYNNLYGDISVEFSTLTGERKLNYLIPDKKALGIVPNDANFLVFEEQIILPNGWTHSDSVKGIVIKNERSEEVFTYTNPYSTDAINQITKEKNTFFESFIDGSVLTIKTKVKTSWLLDNQRTYPIKVDPTINVTPNNNANWTGLVWDDGEYDPSTIIIGRALGYWINGSVRFNLSAIPVGATVTASTGFINILGVYGANTTSRTWAFTNSNDPLSVPTGVSAQGLALYNSMATIESASMPVAGLGWRSSLFSSGGNTYIQNGIASGYISMGLYAAGTWTNGQYFETADRTSINRPYLTITYTSPSCFAPSNLNVDTITSTSARFTWNAASPAPAQGYDYYYNTTGIAPTGGPSGTVGAGVLSATQTGLTSNTVYHFWVRSKCNGTTSVSSWVYGGYFNTNPAQNCFQGDGQVKGVVQDGLGVQMNDVYRVADDFIVPAGQAFTLSDISLEAMSANAITNVTINIRANNNGSPGAVLNTVWNNAAPTTAAQYTTVSGFNVYHLNFTLPTTYNYPPGIYWVEVTMRNSNNSVVYWRATTGGSTGAVSQNSGNSGTTWVANAAGYNMVFYVAGTCITCNPVTADSKIICAGNTVALNVNSPVSGYTYNWYINWNETTQTGTLIGTGTTINVTPSQSTVYRLTGQSSTCSGYTLVTVAISPGPSVVVATPVSAITCSNEIAKLDVSGGAIPSTIFKEDFTPLKHSWTTYTSTVGGAGPLSAAWALYTNGTNSFAMADSDAYGPYQMETSLISEPMSFQDYSTVTLEFDHYFRQYLAASTGFVEISKDGGLTWSNIATFNTTRGSSFTNWQTESYNLNAYAGQGFVQIRFRYVANNAWYWAVNEIRINGTPLSTTVTWSPWTGLYKDIVGTPYTGGNTTTVYASPAVTTTYTASAKTSVGCPSTVNVTVERGDKDWSGTNQNWNIGSNWSGGTVPTANHCVIIPSTAQKPVISVGTDAYAKNLTVQAGGGLTINGGLTVTDFLKNNATAADVLIASDASLRQIADTPTVPNTGSVTAKRNITLSATRQQYNYLISPLENQSLASIYFDAGGNPVAVPFVLYHNEANNKFYTSSGAYIKGRALAVKEPTAAAFPTGPMSSTFTGKPTNGAFTFGMVSSSLTDPNQGYNLTGNPYPSNIDMQKLYDINGGKTGVSPIISPNISPTFYFWDNTGNSIFSQQGSNYAGQSYALFNVLTGVNGSGTAANSGTKVPSKIVKVGQGFMARTLVSSYSLNFNNSIRTTASAASGYFGKNGSSVQDDRYWLKMTSPSGVVSTIALVYFSAGNNLFGPEDSRTMGGSDAVYSIVESEKTAINGRSTFVDTDRIPLGTTHFADGTYSFALEGTEGIFANGQQIYLKDVQTGIITDLSQGSYTFSAQAGESTGRFEILYKPETVLATNTTVRDELVVYKDHSDFVIQAKTRPITGVEIYDTTGRLVFTVQPNSTKVVIPAETLVNGVYILKINQNGAVTSKKVIR